MNLCFGIGVIYNNEVGRFHKNVCGIARRLIEVLIEDVFEIPMKVSAILLFGTCTENVLRHYLHHLSTAAKPLLPLNYAECEEVSDLQVFHSHCFKEMGHFSQSCQRLVTSSKPDCVNSPLL